MFALAALIVFLLALFGVALGSINMVVLGLALLSAHFVFGGGFYPVLPARRP
jgi:hypothetical protein